MQVMYHGTPYSNMMKLMDEGIKPGYDGIVYLCEKPEDCAKFLYVRGITDIVVFKVKIPRKLEHNLQETFDHSQAFFKCRAFGYFGELKPEMIEPVMKYNL